MRERVIEYVSHPLPSNYTVLISLVIQWFHQSSVLSKIKIVDNID